MILGKIPNIHMLGFLSIVRYNKWNRLNHKAVVDLIIEDLRTSPEQLREILSDHLVSVIILLIMTTHKHRKFHLKLTVREIIFSGSV